MRVRFPPKWACSAVGSAPEWHSGGHRFDPGQVHHPSLALQARSDGEPASYLSPAKDVHHSGSSVSSRPAKVDRHNARLSPRGSAAFAHLLDQAGQNQRYRSSTGREIQRIARPANCDTARSRVGSKRSSTSSKGSQSEALFYTGVTDNIPQGSANITPVGALTRRPTPPGRSTSSCNSLMKSSTRLRTLPEIRLWLCLRDTSLALIRHRGPSTSCR